MPFAAIIYIFPKSSEQAKSERVSGEDARVDETQVRNNLASDLLRHSVLLGLSLKAILIALHSCCFLYYSTISVEELN